MTDNSLQLSPLVLKGANKLLKTVDENLGRPAIVMLGGSLDLTVGYRTPSGIHARDTDKGLGSFYDGSLLPKLKIGFSHHDFARAFIVAHGTVSIKVGTLTSDVGILVLPEPDGTYGVGSKITVANLNGFRLGILYAGQRDFDFRIGKTKAYLWNSEPMGHSSYANECRNESGEFLRAVGGSVRIAQNRTFQKEAWLNHDHSTFKTKGSHGVYLECFDDDNPCGSLDAFDSSGLANLGHKSRGGGARTFQAFRIGKGSFGSPPGNMCVMGSFDESLSDQSVPSYRLESPNGRFAGVKVKGSAPVVWQGCDGFGSVVEAVSVD